MRRPGITKRGAEILAMVLASPEGMSSREVGSALGITQPTASEHLRKLRDLRLVGPVAHGGPRPKWMAYGDAEHRRSVLAETTREERNRLRQRRLRLVAELREESMPRHRLVDALQCRQFRPRAPASVFYLAA